MKSNSEIQNCGSSGYGFLEFRTNPWQFLSFLTPILVIKYTVEMTRFVSGKWPGLWCPQYQLHIHKKEPILTIRGFRTSCDYTAGWQSAN